MFDPQAKGKCDAYGLVSRRMPLEALHDEALFRKELQDGIAYAKQRLSSVLPSDPNWFVICFSTQILTYQEIAQFAEVELEEVSPVESVNQTPDEK